MQGNSRPTSLDSACVCEREREGREREGGERERRKEGGRGEREGGRERERGDHINQGHS